MLNFLKSRKWLITGIVAIITCVSLLGVQVKVVPNNNTQVIGQTDFVITIGTVAEASATVDYACDGTDDNIQFQGALDSLPANGGTIEILSGNYDLANATTVTRALANVTIYGTGRGTYITCDGVTAIFTAGGNNWQIRDLRTDAGGLQMGATTGWSWTNVTLNATCYDYRNATNSVIAGAATFGSVTDSALTSTRVTFAGVGGLLADDVDLTFTGGDTLGATKITSGAITDTGLTATRVPIVGIGGLLADDADFTYSTVTDLIETPTGRTASYVIAAHDAPATWLAQADYVMPTAASDLGAVVNAAIAAGYKVITTSESPAEMFSVTTKILLNDGGIILHGQGLRGRWVLANNANVDMISVTEAQCRLETLELRGNNANNVTSSGVVISGNGMNTKMDWVRILDFNDYGVELQGGVNCYAMEAHNVDSEQNGSDGFYIHGGGGNVITECSSHNNAGHGYYFTTNGLTESIITDNYADSNAKIGFYTTNGAEFTMNNNHSKNNTWAGFQIVGVQQGTTNNNTSNVNGNGNYEMALINAVSTSMSFNAIEKNGVAGSDFGLFLENLNDCVIEGNTINHDETGLSISSHGVADDNIIAGNTFINCSTMITVNDPLDWTDNRIYGNTGIVTQNSGLATVPNTAVTIVVNHGLSTTPSTVIISPRENPTNAVAFWWVDTLTATQFTIHVNADPGASNLDFDWRAVVGGGN